MKKILVFSALIALILSCFVACDFQTSHTHEFSEWSVTRDPTCIENGEKVRFCDCDEEERDVVPATGHNYVDDVCDRCGDVNESAACKHENIEILLGSAPTCTEVGFTVGEKCSDCGTVLIEQKTIVALDHDWAEATCTEPKTCMREGCGITEGKENGHSFGDWVTVKDATEYEEGIKEKSCACGERETETIDKCSAGLSYVINPDNKSYSVFGIGDCTDTDIVIPSTHDGKPVTGISYYAFRFCYEITSVVIPNSVTAISYDAFERCTSLTTVVIPDSVISIRERAFEYCTSLNSVVIPDSVTSINSCAFKDCTSLTSVVIGNGLTTISKELFYNCSALTSVVIPDSVTSIGDDAFSKCTALSSVVIGSGVATIGEHAFESCAITSIVIPDNVISIGYEVFIRCRSLTSITIGAGAEDIHFCAFRGCPGLLDITVDPNNASYTSIDGNLYSKDESELLCYAAGKPDTYFAIPEGVTSIGSNAFYYCESLTSVVIPDGVTSIGGAVFSNCKSLTSVVIGDNVTTISDWAFSNCLSLTTIVIGARVTSIGNGAFTHCSALSDVYYAYSKEMWDLVMTIDLYNEYLTSATFHYNYVP